MTPTTDPTAALEALLDTDPAALGDLADTAMEYANNAEIGADRNYHWHIAEALNHLAIAASYRRDRTD